MIVLDVSANKLGLDDGDEGVTTLPSGIFIGCSDLRHLDLSKNKLTKLPPALRSAVQLRSLLLGDNPLGTCSLRNVLPLCNLETLDLQGTGRTADALPDELSTALTGLRELNVSRNKLDVLPECVAAMPSLVRLDLGDNCIATLPTSLQGCRALTVLVLSRNRIEVLPEGFVRCTPVLRRLYMNRNRLTSLPEAVGELAQLEQLQVSGNALESLPAALFTGCSLLKQLRVERNRLVTVSLLPIHSSCCR